MKINKETRTYRLHGTNSLLGSNPADPEVHTRYVTIKAGNLEKQAMEEAMLPGSEELAEALKKIKESGLTVFLRGSHGELVVGAHCIKGFFKAAFSTLKDQFGVAAAKSKIDNLVFVKPDFIPILDAHNEPQTEPDGYCERSLRAETMQGPRVTLASSEEVAPPWQLEFSITLVDNAGTGKSKPVTWELVEAALDYGELKGLGQWRNSGRGAFTWERIA